MQFRQILLAASREHRQHAYMRDVADTIPGCILLGGRSRRFGGDDKSQLMFAGATLLDQVILRAKLQVGDLALALGHKSLSQIGASGLPPLRDEFGDAGPLGGLHAAMKWAKPQADYIATFACDTPCFPDEMVTRLAIAAAANPAGIALPQGHGRVHTALGVWSTALLAEIARAITSGELAFTRWAMERGAVLVDFPRASAIDFFNINTPDDAQRYREWLGI